MSRQEKERWSYLEIVGRVRADVNDAEWRCVKRYDDATLEFANDELARLRSGDSTAALFRDYEPEEVEFRLQRVTSTAYYDTEVLA